MSTQDQYGTRRSRPRSPSTPSLPARSRPPAPVALALTAGLATPLNPAPEQAEAKAGGKKVLTVAVAQSVDSLSPFLAQRLVSTSIHRLTYEYLTNYDAKDNHAIPGFATKLEVLRRTS